MPRNRRWREGTCPVCDRENQKIASHHCHLRDLVRDGLVDGLTSLSGDSDRARAVLHANQMWSSDKGIVAIVRFETLDICDDCNQVDVVDPLSRPGPGFSLSPLELKEIRQAAGHAENSGQAFLQALRTVRRRVTDDYRLRASLAPHVGRSIAVRFYSERRFEAARPA